MTVKYVIAWSNETAKTIKQIYWLKRTKRFKNLLFLHIITRAVWLQERYVSENIETVCNSQFMSYLRQYVYCKALDQAQMV